MKNNLLKNVLYINNKEYEVGFSSVGCNMGRNDFYTIIQKTKENTHIGKSTDYAVKFGFNTLNEALNFKNYLKTKIVRFALTIYKTNQNLVNRKNNFSGGSIESVPYMPTYKHEWTDEMIAKELNLSNEELK